MDALAVALQMGTLTLLSKLLQIFTAIPVTAATNQRSFSALKLLKTFLFTTTVKNRQRSLVHLYISKNIHLDLMQ